MHTVLSSSRGRTSQIGFDWSPGLRYVAIARDGLGEGCLSGRWSTRALYVTVTAIIGVYQVHPYVYPSYRTPCVPKQRALHVTSLCYVHS